MEKSFFGKFKYDGPDQADGIVYNSVRVYGWPKTIVLGLQHIVAMSGATIIVPILVAGYFVGIGAKVSTALFFAGVATLFFQLVTFAKVPIFLGSSFAFLGGYQAVANMTNGQFATLSMEEKFQYASGGVVVAGLMYLVLALLMKLAGTKRVMKYLPPTVTGPIVVCIGASLFGSAFDNYSQNWILATIAAALIVIFNVRGKGIIKIIPILMSAVISYAIAVVMHLLGFTNADGSAIINTAAINGASLIGPPSIVKPMWELNSTITMVVCALPAMVEHIGDINAVSIAAKRSFTKFPGLHRTLLGDGAGTSIAGIFGGFPNTSYGENTGVVAITKNADPRGHRIAAYGAIILGCSPLISAAIGTIPTAIIGGISLALYGMISIIGFRNLIENKTDFMNERNLWVAVFIIAFGIGVTYRYPNGIAIPHTTISLSGLALASIIGILLNAILNVWSKSGRDLEKRNYGDDAYADANRGIALSSLKKD